MIEKKSIESTKRTYRKRGRKRERQCGRELGELQRMKITKKNSGI